MPTSLLECTREIELAFLVTPLCAVANELAVSEVERSFKKCLLSIARGVEVLDSRRGSLGRDSSIFSRYTRERSPRFSWTLLSISFYVLLIPLSSSNFYAIPLSRIDTPIDFSLHRSRFPFSSQVSPSGLRSLFSSYQRNILRPHFPKFPCNPPLFLFIFLRAVITSLCKRLLFFIIAFVAFFGSRFHCCKANN